MRGQSEGGADDGNRLGRINRRGGNNRERCGLAIQNLLVDGSNHPPSIVEPGEVTVASAVDVIQAGLDENLPIARYRRLLTNQNVTDLLDNKTRLLANETNIQLLEARAIDEVRSIKVDTNAFADIAPVKRVAAGHQQREGDATSNNTNATHRTPPLNSPLGSVGTTERIVQGDSTTFGDKRYACLSAATLAALPRHAATSRIG